MSGVTMRDAAAEHKTVKTTARYGAEKKRDERYEETYRHGKKAVKRGRQYTRHTVEEVAKTSSHPTRSSTRQPQRTRCFRAVRKLQRQQRLQPTKYSYLVGAPCSTGSGMPQHAATQYAALPHGMACRDSSVQNKVQAQGAHTGVTPPAASAVRHPESTTNSTMPAARTQRSSDARRREEGARYMARQQWRRTRRFNPPPVPPDRRRNATIRLPRAAKRERRQAPRFATAASTAQRDAPPPYAQRGHCRETGTPAHACQAPMPRPPAYRHAHRRKAWNKLAEVRPGRVRRRQQALKKAVAQASRESPSGEVPASAPGSFLPQRGVQQPSVCGRRRRARSCTAALAFQPSAASVRPDARAPFPAQQRKEGKRVARGTAGSGRMQVRACSL